MNSQQSFEKTNSTAKVNLDPRTKLILLVTLPIFLLGNAGGSEMYPFQIIFSFLPFLLMFLSGNYKKAMMGLVAIIGVQIVWTYFSVYLGGGLYIVLYILYGIIMGVLPCAIMGTYVLSTTKISEFVVGMERFHIPYLITIPLSVMFRFFPTVKEEATSINRAMKMRGIRFGKQGISKMVEYRIVPIMMCTVRIGDELTAASLTRGLGAPIKHTSICSIGFHASDIIILALCMSAYFVWILGAFGVYLW